MNLQLKDRVAIVTGGSEGIGRAIALSLAVEGAKIVICARRKAPLLAVRKEIEKAGGVAFDFSVDATDPSDIKKLIDAVVEKWGRIDILVNNVGGIDKFAGFMELTPEDWTKAFNLNVLSVVSFVKYAFPFLCKSNFPRIINISSISGVQPGFYNFHYTTTKAAVINLSKCLSNEFAKHNILVNVVCPGPVHSKSWLDNIKRKSEKDNISFNEEKDKIEIEESRKILLGRVGEATDISGLVSFLASDQASWITGSCFHINGGKLQSIF